MASPNQRQQAWQLLHEGYRAQMRGELEESVELYSRSIAAFPTAEAYTFRGWAYSFQGDYARAIEECKQAIGVDPEFGNPYNDIGAYLIEIGRWEEAIPWLEKAARAQRYTARCFPRFNLGRVYEHQRRLSEAQRQYELALSYEPNYTPARQALKRLCAAWN